MFALDLRKKLPWEAIPSSRAGYAEVVQSIRKVFKTRLDAALAEPRFEPHVGRETITARGMLQTALTSAVPLTQVMVSSCICLTLFVATTLKEALHVRFQGIILYALVLYDLQQGSSVHIKHKWLLFVLLSTPSFVSAQSLKQ